MPYTYLPVEAEEEIPRSEQEEQSKQVLASSTQVPVLSTQGAEVSTQVPGLSTRGEDVSKLVPVLSRQAAGEVSKPELVLSKPGQVPSRREEQV